MRRRPRRNIKCNVMYGQIIDCDDCCAQLWHYTKEIRRSRRIRYNTSDYTWHTRADEKRFLPYQVFNTSIYKYCHRSTSSI